MEPWPEDSTKRSRLIHLGSSGLWFICLPQMAYAAGAAPMGMPGWPDLAFWTPSAASMRMAFTTRSERADLTFSTLSTVSERMVLTMLSLLMRMHSCLK